jgi:hypothetical protein
MLATQPRTGGHGRAHRPPRMHARGSSTQPRARAGELEPERRGRAPASSNPSVAGAHGQTRPPQVRAWELKTAAAAVGTRRGAQLRAPRTRTGRPPRVRGGARPNRRYHGHVPASSNPGGHRRDRTWPPPPSQARVGKGHGGRFQFLTIMALPRAGELNPGRCCRRRARETQGRLQDLEARVRNAKCGP